MNVRLPKSHPTPLHFATGQSVRASIGPAGSLLGLLSIAIAVACGGCDRPKRTIGDPAAKQSQGRVNDAAAEKPTIVATTGMIADIARNLAGPRAQVVQLMGEGVDPHLYKPAPGDLRLFESADLILHNGLHLEGKLADALQRLGDRKPVLAVGEGIDTQMLLTSAQFEGHPDPHIWFDPRLWSLATERAAGGIQALLPASAEGIATARRKYQGELAAMHEWAVERIATIPAGHRVLVTAHDAFSYFGRAYGLEVHGVQGISTDSEASIRDVNALVDLLVERRIPAVFFESSVPSKTVEALVEGCRARRHTVRVGGELFSDAMGAANSPEGTYQGMFRHNVNTIVAALGGEVVAGGSEANVVKGTASPNAEDGNR